MESHKCLMCGEVSENEADHWEHQRAKHKVFNWKHFGKGGQDKENVEPEVIAEKAALMEAKKKCLMCGFESDDQKAFWLHQRERHGVVNWRHL